MIIDVKKPKINIIPKGTNSADFVIEPLERGFGTTLGNCLRRILLSTLPGVAPIGIKIEGAEHEFKALKGIKEDVTDIILNVKDLAIEANAVDINFKQKCRIVKHTPGVVTAKDIECSSEIKIKNEDAYICTLDDNASLEMDIYLGAGRGYVSASDHKKAAENEYSTEVGYISIDSIYTPVVTASYNVEPARDGDDMTKEKLTVSVTTNGASSPKDVLSFAANYMMSQIALLVNLEEAKDTIVFKTQEEVKKEDTTSSRRIEDLGLRNRSYNCLKRIGVNTIEDLLKKSEDDLLKAKNLGKISINEIIEKLEELGLGLKPKDEI